VDLGIQWRRRGVEKEFIHWGEGRVILVEDGLDIKDEERLRHRGSRGQGVELEGWRGRRV